MAQLTEHLAAQDAEKDRLSGRYDAVRKFTVTLADPLSEEDCCAQSMPDASPVKWHMAHTTWFFETFILEKFQDGFKPFHPAFRMLFNSYYNGVGEKHVRAQRGLLTRPSFDEVLAYRHHVDASIGSLFARLGDSQETQEIARLVDLGLQHEQQHQELLLTDVKHLLSMNPLKPAYKQEALPEGRQNGQSTGGMEQLGGQAAGWKRFDAGIVTVGHAGDGFCFDNEMPRHRQFVEAYSLADRLVTNAEYLAFVEDGAYRNPVLWLSEGWDWIKANRLSHPLYWSMEQGESDWQEFTLHGLVPLQQDVPVTHLSYFEADAFARWAGARLPTEAEWEHAAQAQGPAPASGRHALHPQPVCGNEGVGLKQMFGACWQWTSSAYGPYPGYKPVPGAVGEYNGKFMVNQYVLRGSSCVTPELHARTSYRNFFPATSCWQFAGLRLARSD